MKVCGKAVLIEFELLSDLLLRIVLKWNCSAAADLVTKRFDSKSSDLEKDNVSDLFLLSKSEVGDVFLRFPRQ